MWNFTQYNIFLKEDLKWLESLTSGQAQINYFGSLLRRYKPSLIFYQIFLMFQLSYEFEGWDILYICWHHQNLFLAYKIHKYYLTSLMTSFIAISCEGVSLVQVLTLYYIQKLSVYHIRKRCALKGLIEERKCKE